jgi:hypothetical protein
VVFSISRIKIGHSYEVKVISNYVGSNAGNSQFFSVTNPDAPSLGLSAESVR